MARLLVLCGLVGLSGTAAAQSPRYVRPSFPPVTVTLSDRVRVPVPGPVDPARGRPVALTQDAAILSGPIRAETEQLLVTLLQDTPDSEVDEKSDLYFRLGQNYAQLHQYWKPKPGAVAASKTKDYLLKTVKTFRALTENEAFRNYPKLDAALFYLGYTLQSGSYLKEARAAYFKLLKNYPNSMFVPQAQLSFADYFFDAKQLAEAEASYKLVLTFPKSSTYPYALYKMGWVNLELQRYSEALESFFQVVQLTKGDAKQLVLSQAAQQGVLAAYAAVGSADKAAAVFTKIDPAHAVDLLEALAGRYSEDGKSSQAIYLYRDLIKTAPNDPHVCRWQYGVARAMQWSPGAAAIDKVHEVEKLVTTYVAVKAANTAPAAELQECHDNAAAMSGELARAYHLEASKAKTTEALASAEILYKAYAAGFPDAPDAALVRAGYADLLWDRAAVERNPRLQPAAWHAAASELLAAATSSQDPRRRSELVTAAVMARKNALDVDPRPSVQAGAIDLEAASRAATTVTPMTAEQQDILRTFELYVTDVTERDEQARAKFLMATLYRRFHQDAKATVLLADLLEHHHEHETAELAANLLLDSMIRLRRLDDVLAVVDSLASDKAFMTGKAVLKSNIDLLRSRSLRRR